MGQEFMSIQSIVIARSFGKMIIRGPYFVRHMADNPDRLLQERPIHTHGFSPLNFGKIDL
jgi:hypothetical protein